MRTNLLSPRRHAPGVPPHACIHSRRPCRWPLCVLQRVNEVSWGGDGGQRSVVIFLFMFHLLFSHKIHLCLDKCSYTQCSTFYFLFSTVYTLTNPQCLQSVKEYRMNPYTCLYKHRVLSTLWFTFCKAGKRFVFVSILFECTIDICADISFLYSLSRRVTM